MTAEIKEDTIRRAMRQSESDSRPPLETGDLFRYVKIFTVATTAAALIALAISFPLDEWRIALGGCTLAILAGLGGTVLLHRALLADRQDFYNRGQLDGWHRGWHGQLPEVDDPLIR